MARAAVLVRAHRAEPAAHTHEHRATSPDVWARERAGVRKRFRLVEAIDDRGVLDAALTQSANAEFRSNVSKIYWQWREQADPKAAELVTEAAFRGRVRSLCSRFNTKNKPA